LTVHPGLSLISPGDLPTPSNKEAVTLEELCQAVAHAIRERTEAGRSYGQLAIELGVHPRTIGYIVTGRRNVGLKTLGLVKKANAPWLRELFGGNCEPNNGRNGKGPKGLSE
jgi:hypothetical protein